MAVLIGKFILPVFNSHRHKLKPRMMSSANRCELKGDKTLVLTLTNKEDQHLLDPEFIKSIRERLDEAKSRATRGASVLITTAEGDSFCRGFDYRYARKQEKDRRGGDDAWREMINGFEGVVGDLISLPMPTIAAVNGYATGAGLMLAFSHDYLTMKPETDSLRSEHLAQKISLPPYFAALLRSKVSSPMDRHNLVLRDLRFNSEQADEMGLIYKIPSTQKSDFYEQATSLAQTLYKKWSDRNVNGEVYAELRKAMLPELCQLLGLTCTTISPEL